MVFCIQDFEQFKLPRSSSMRKTQNIAILALASPLPGKQSGQIQEDEDSRSD